MIEHELILLGLLKESPKHGYEIKKKIKEILFFFAGLDLKSVYYPLSVLEKQGQVTKHVDRQGRRPQRFIYSLTPKGRARFDELLEKSFLNFKRPQFMLDSSLYFLNDLDARIAKRRLRARMVILKRISRALKLQFASLKVNRPALLNGAPGIPKGGILEAAINAHSCSKEQEFGLQKYKILEHNLRMLEAESKFLAGLIKAI